MIDEPTCVRDFKYGKLVNYKWFGKHFGTKIKLNPEIKLHEIANLVNGNSVYVMYEQKEIGL